MLNYATIDDFMQMKDIGTKTGSITAPTNRSIDKIEKYITRATRFIHRFTRRDFLPWIETRNFAPPYAYIDLAVRQMPRAHLKLDQDLLEAITVMTGDTVIDTDNYFLLEHNIYPKHIIAISYPGSWGITLGRRYDQATISIEGIWGYQDAQYAMENEAWVDTDEVVEDGGITSTVTTLNVDDADGIDGRGETRFVVGRLIRIDNEFMEITDISTSTNKITVKRGVRGSTKVAHEEGTTIKTWHVVDDIVEATIQIAKVFREQDISAGNRIAVSDRGSDVEGVPVDSLKLVQMYVRSMLHG